MAFTNVTNVTNGTNTFKRIRELNAARNLNMAILSGKDHAKSMLLMTSGRALAFFEDDILLTGMAASSVTPADFALSTEGCGADPCAIMFAKGDVDFKKIVDGLITDLYKAGEINKVCERWFVKSIPPKNITLNFPMGAVLKNVIARPTDSLDAAA